MSRCVAAAVVGAAVLSAGGGCGPGPPPVQPPEPPVVTVDHPGIGPLEHPGALARYSETPSEFRPYPLMGEHNHMVFCDILKLPEAEFAERVCRRV